MDLKKHTRLLMKLYVCRFCLIVCLFLKLPEAVFSAKSLTVRSSFGKRAMSKCVGLNVWYAYKLCFESDEERSCCDGVHT